jgi:hypothetical protein
MTGSLTEHEAALRLAAFAGVFAVVALWEWFAPRRRARFGRGQRWPHNVALLVAVVPLDLAIYCGDRRWVRRCSY